MKGPGECTGRAFIAEGTRLPDLQVASAEHRYRIAATRVPLVYLGLVGNLPLRSNWWSSARGRRSLAPRVGHVDTATQPSLPPSRRLEPGDLPPGTSSAEVRELLESLAIDGAPVGELANYVAEDFERFVITWSMTRGMSGRLLEIGANPYFTTVLLLEYSELSIELSNFFGISTRAEYDHQLIRYLRANGEVVDRSLEFRTLNVEVDRFPYDDNSFDTVLFCEVIEHLQTDPVAALLEIRRILRSDGHLVLTTPNVARLENVARILAGANIYDPYSGYGAYGRHNREFTRHELHRLLTYCGFESIESFTADVHDHNAEGFFRVGAFAPLVERRSPDLGQYLFVKAVAGTGPPVDRRPSFLYRSLPEGVIETFE